MKTSILAFITALVLLASTACAQSQVKKVNSTEAAQLIKNSLKMVILDVRTAEEFNAGHIKGAINIDISQPDAFAKINKLDHQGQYLILCRTHRRSKVAVDHMIQSGFKNVYQMMDGFAGWSQNAQPITK